MKIIRFVDRHGHERLGADPVADAAEMLEGELFAELSRSGRRVGPVMSSDRARSAAA